MGRCFLSAAFAPWVGRYSPEFFQCPAGSQAERAQKDLESINVPSAHSAPLPKVAAPVQPVQAKKDVSIVAL